MKQAPYRQAEWKPVVSADTELALSTWRDDYARNGYETGYRKENGVVRLYVRAIA